MLPPIIRRCIKTTLDLSNPEAKYLGPNHYDNDLRLGQMANFAAIDQDHCCNALVVHVSGSVRDDIGLLNYAVDKFRDTVLADPVSPQGWRWPASTSTTRPRSGSNSVPSKSLTPAHRKPGAAP